MSNNNTEFSTVKFLLNTYGNLQPLTSEETTSLIKKVSEDKSDNDSINSLLFHNIKFIYNQVKGYKNFEEDDLIMAAVEGMINAIKEITVSKLMSICEKSHVDANHALLIFSKGFINSCVYEEIRSNEPLAVTEYECKHIRKVRAAMNTVDELYGDTISYEEKLMETANRANLTLKQTKQALDSSTNHVSLFTPVASSNKDEELRMADVLEDKTYQNIVDVLINENMKTNIDEAMATLSDVQREVIKDFIGLDNRPQLSVTNIAHVYNKSRQWVYNTLESSYALLRNAVQDLEAYYLIG